MVYTKEQIKKYMKKRYYLKIKEYYNYLGNKCKKCETNKNLEFDHINHKNKKYTIGKIWNYNKKIVYEELNKCQLLCRKCHLKKSINEGSLGKNNRVGEKVNFSKLKKNEVKEILKSDEPVKYLANKYLVTNKTIYNIKNKITWKHINTTL